ncbi:MAG: hypothetical protein PHW33_05010 [Candidatus Portnoybacteria bacterium]|jgi:hypothetical protein|nr:hypothetical protein [Candidatus Portnoybacteria bacterium]
MKGLVAGKDGLFMGVGSAMSFGNSEAVEDNQRVNRHDTLAHRRETERAPVDERVAGEIPDPETWLLLKEESRLSGRSLEDILSG